MVVIRQVNIQNSDIARRLHELQLAAYQVESRLIGYPHLPPLRETVEALQQAGEQFLVWQEEAQFLGAVGYIQAGSTLEICRLAVSPTHFRRGIAAGLLEAVEIIKPGIRRATVSTAEKNLPAVTLYEKHGYRITQRTVLDDALVLVELQKQVNP